MEIGSNTSVTKVYNIPLLCNFTAYDQVQELIMFILETINWLSSQISVFRDFPENRKLHNSLKGFDWFRHDF